jgi:hypothetical protein
VGLPPLNSGSCFRTWDVFGGFLLLQRCISGWIMKQPDIDRWSTHHLTKAQTFAHHRCQIGSATSLHQLVTFHPAQALMWTCLNELPVTRHRICTVLPNNAREPQYQDMNEFATRRAKVQETAITAIQTPHLRHMDPAARPNRSLSPHKT